MSEPIPKMNVRVKACEIGPYTLTTTLKDVCQFFETMRERYGDDATMQYGCYDDYSDDLSFMIYTVREETEKEYAARLERIQTRQMEEVLLYKQLREKYGNIK